MHPLRRHGPRAGAAATALLLLLSATPVATLASTTITVDATGDSVDLVNDGVCADANGECTLRAAVMEANRRPGADTIVLPVGTYTLTLQGRAEYGSATGDLNVLGDLTVEGSGAADTIIQASATGVADGIDRLFDVRGPGVGLTLMGVTLRYGNPGDASGGAIMIPSDDHSLTLQSVRLVDNAAPSNSGGAIEGSGTVVIEDSLIADNDAKAGGGGIEQWDGSLTVRRTTFSGNTAANGGAIRIAGIGAGGLISASTFTGNQADVPAIQLGRGGSTEHTDLTIRRSTFAGNVGTAATVAARSGNTLTLESVTIAGNTGRGLSTGATTTVLNSILAGNSLVSCQGTVTSLGHNLDSGSSCPFDQAGDLLNADAKLGGLAANGGPTKTVALQSGSAAIDAGASCGADDQRGFARPVDGDSDGTATCDIGAYEAAEGTSDASAATPTPAATATPAATTTPEPTATPAATSTPAATPTSPTEPSATPAPTDQPDATPTATPSDDPGGVPGEIAGGTSDPGITPPPTDTFHDGSPASGNGLGAVLLALGLISVLVLGLRPRKAARPR